MRAHPEFPYLIYQLLLRDIKGRYKQTFLGALWVFGRPLLELGVFVLVFGAFLRAPTGGVAYVPFALVGVVLWSFVASGLSRATRSLTAYRDLVAQAPFPKLALPLSVLAAALLDTLVAGVVLGALFVLGDPNLSLAALWIVPIGLVLLALITGLSLVCCTLNVFYHDFGHLVDLGVRVWLLLTPVAYARVGVPERFRAFYDLNPLVAVFEGARTALLEGRTPDLASLVYPVAAAALVLGAGALLFHHAEPLFAESV